RFQLNPKSPNIAWVTDIQYIQQPDDFFAVNPAAVPNVRTLTVSGSTAYLTEQPAPPPPPKVSIPQGDFSNGNGFIYNGSSYVANNLAVWPVQPMQGAQPGDYLEVNGSQIRQIASITYCNGVANGDPYGPDSIPGVPPFNG